MSSPLNIIPLGGLGEIGLNMMAYQCGDDIIIADCGLMFPEPDMLGIDYVIPDISWLRERFDAVRGICLTHGHEDHIGALPFVLQEMNVPVYGTALTLGFVNEKLKEYKLDDKVDLVVVKPRDVVELGCFLVEFLRVAHSVVDGCALAITTPEGVVIHTGDFKIDQTPVDGELTDLPSFARYGERGVLALLSDSTNVEREGYTISEKFVGEAFAQIFPHCSGRIIVAAFSSNIHRVQQVADAAIALGRKILLNGRSMIANVRIARQLGYLNIPDDMIMDLRELNNLPPEQVCMVTTGSQGEPMSSLVRIAMDDHKQIKLEKGDTVILSSRFIPGNERTISELINHLYRRGAEVHYETTSEIHVSGHAGRDELKTVHSLVRPHYFVPVHGEYRHLTHHARLAREMGMPAERVLVIENGQPLLLSPNGHRLEPRVESGRVFVDGKGVGDVGEMELRDRRHLANHGLVLVFMALNQATGEIVAGPEIVTRGFVLESEGRPLLDEALALVQATLAEHSREAVAGWEELRVEVRKALHRFFNRTMDRRPLIVPYIMEM